MGPHDGLISPQVFEYSLLYRSIAIQGRTAIRFVRHPMNAGWVRRDGALALVRRVSPEVQAIITAERSRQSLSLMDEDPVNDADRELYQQTMNAISSP